MKHDMNIKIDTKEQFVALYSLVKIVGYTYCDGSEILPEHYSDPTMGTIVHVYIDIADRIIWNGFDGSLFCDDYEAAEDFEEAYENLKNIIVEFIMQCIQEERDSISLNGGKK